jgi:UDP-glucose:(glucosyl)LPS alpha-1,2-glucosyltransferase
VGGIAWNAGSGGSFGGTELMGRELERRLPADLLDRFQIHITPLTAAEPGKIQILWCHIDHGAPEYAQLSSGGWQKFQRIVFVSNWQAQGFIDHFGIPWSRCLVMPNAIKPLAVGDDRFDPLPADLPIRLVYTSVPNRGLIILHTVFREICRERDDVELDVFSSFKLYGWDMEYERLFDALRQNPRASYHGAVPNQQLRSALASSHVLAYPAILRETSSLSLMEAMSAGLACVHPNYGGLYETAANWTSMYQWQDELPTHATVFYEALMAFINALREGNKMLLSRLTAQKAYADMHYNWDIRGAHWEAFLRSIAHFPPETDEPP